MSSLFGKLNRHGLAGTSLKDRFAGRKASPGVFIWTFTITGLLLDAMIWLEKGFRERDDLMINLKVEPVFDSLRADPRFQDLVRRVGIPEGKP